MMNTLDRPDPRPVPRSAADAIAARMEAARNAGTPMTFAQVEAALNDAAAACAEVCRADERANHRCHPHLPKDLG